MKPPPKQEIPEIHRGAFGFTTDCDGELFDRLDATKAPECGGASRRGLLSVAIVGVLLMGLLIAWARQDPASAAEVRPVPVVQTVSDAPGWSDAQTAALESQKETSAPAARR